MSEFETGRAIGLKEAVRLQWCRERSTWNCADWGRIVYSDESRFFCVLTTVANVSGDVLVSVWILSNPTQAYQAPHHRSFQCPRATPDLRAWIFGSGLEDDDLAILASAKSIIYRYFVHYSLLKGRPLIPLLLQKDAYEIAPVELQLGLVLSSLVLEVLWGLERLAPGFHRRVKAKTSFKDDDVPIDDDTTTKPLFTPQENGGKDLKLAEFPLKMNLGKDAQNVQKITDLIKENPRTTLLELEQDTGISKTTIGRIVTKDLKLKKTPAKFIPIFLTNEQKLCRLATCENMLEMTRTDPEWKDKIITGDETWVYDYDPETKRQYAEWRGQDIAPNDFFLFPKLEQF
ncbi:hypothetical protein LAZ67_3001488 [Cordylochernes scorpioides]|uniref:Uncharacterized protein n=1 Tax=Cordylochernes scorpioides TaxID=51811 RepID=A0ABY6K9Y6_9ARAC|nr:hypothetical protein LAZ67_3001488 [Cordylochernes scorpioides]